MNLSQSRSRLQGGTFFLSAISVVFLGRFRPACGAYQTITSSQESEVVNVSVAAVLAPPLRRFNKKFTTSQGAGGEGVSAHDKGEPACDPPLP